MWIFFFQSQTIFLHIKEISHARSMWLSQQNVDEIFFRAAQQEFFISYFCFHFFFEMALSAQSLVMKWTTTERRRTDNHNQYLTFQHFIPNQINGFSQHKAKYLIKLFFSSFSLTFFFRRGVKILVTFCECVCDFSSSSSTSSANPTAGSSSIDRFWALSFLE